MPWCQCARAELGERVDFVAGVCGASIDVDKKVGLIAVVRPSDEFQWPSWFVLVLVVIYLGVYYVWDTCNSQKNQFRQEEKGVVNERRTFPYFKYGKIHNPVTIQTKQGNRLLCDGWCKYCFISLFCRMLMIE